MANSSIEWTEKTWNPTVGCTKISAGCRHCYAEIMHRRLQAMGKVTGNPKYADDFTVVKPYPDDLAAPYHWRKPSVIFVNSMSDLWHAQLPISYVQEVFAVMNQADWHTYQVLTKRADVLLDNHTLVTWTPNIWQGVSVEREDQIWRIDALRQTGALVKFLSLEPLIGPLYNLNLTGINWVIVGGESGRKPRPMMEEWVQDIRQQCEAQNVAFFFKQWGGQNKKAAGRLLNGQTYDEMPTFKTQLNL